MDYSVQLPHRLTKSYCGVEVERLEGRAHVGAGFNV